MSWWVSLLISLAVKYGLPWLESQLSPSVVLLIKKILGLIKDSNAPGEVLNGLHAHVDKCVGECTKLS